MAVLPLAFLAWLWLTGPLAPQPVNASTIPEAADTSGFSVNPIKTAALFSAPLGHSAHGVHYATVAITLDHRDLCHQIKRVIEAQQDLSRRWKLDATPFDTSREDKSYRRDYSRTCYNRVMKHHNGNSYFDELKYDHWVQQYEAATQWDRCHNVNAFTMSLDDSAKMHNDLMGNRRTRVKRSLVESVNPHNDFQDFILAHEHTLTDDHHKDRAKRSLVLIGFVAGIFIGGITVSLAQTSYAPAQVVSKRDLAIQQGLVGLGGALETYAANQGDLVALVDNLRQYTLTEQTVRRGHSRIGNALRMTGSLMTSTVHGLGEAAKGHFPLEMLASADVHLISDAVKREAARIGAEPVAASIIDLAAGMGAFTMADGQIHITLSVPLVTSKTLLTYYRSYNVPTTLDDGSTVRFNTDGHDYFAMSQSGTLWTTLTAADLLTCKKVSSVAVCDEMSVLRKVPTPLDIQNGLDSTDTQLCIYGLYARNADIIAQTCQATTIQHQQQMIQVDSHQVVVISEGNIPISLECQGSTNPHVNGRPRYAHRNAIVTVPQTCRVHAGMFYYVPTETSSLPDVVLDSSLTWPSGLIDSIDTDPEADVAMNRIKARLERLQRNSSDLQTWARGFKNDMASLPMPAQTHSWLNTALAAVGSLGIGFLALRFFGTALYSRCITCIAGVSANAVAASATTTHHNPAYQPTSYTPAYTPAQTTTPAHGLSVPPQQAAITNSRPALLALPAPKPSAPAFGHFASK